MKLPLLAEIRKAARSKNFKKLDNAIKKYKDSGYKVESLFRVVEK